MPYPSPEDIRKEKRDLLLAILLFFILLAFIVEFGFIFYIAMVS